MLSVETEKKLAELFYETMVGEKLIEEARFNLSRHKDFELNCVFKELDRIGMGSISGSDLKYFLDKNNIICTLDESYAIVHHYDTNSDGRLSINEFSYLILPNMLPIVKDTRSNFPRLSIDAEYLLTRVLENEVRLQRTLEKIRKCLIERGDFNLMEGFRCLDRRNYTRIDFTAFYIFLRRNDFFCVEMDMQHIINRVDMDRDGIVNYVEFVEAVLPKEPHARTRSPPKIIRNSSPLKRSLNGKNYPNTRDVCMSSDGFMNNRRLVN
ncbi:hypothetical protein SteCoe_22797 [Stentor coeruleus]|uniref:EF-hand domain-containing protein n=1 Tax=Stentor coeruleus TaxID=5963 RepID=A0A1R2BL92_9CILI|nr:hypothetical protein SteCoe_22797 [Stentor coeruleus]